MDKVSLLGGSGFIGNALLNKYPKLFYKEARDCEFPKYDKILLAYGTNSNYNIFSDTPTIDFDTNVNKLIRILHNCKDRPIEITLLSSWFKFGGGKPDGPYKETDLSSCLGYYSISKWCQTQVLITFCTFFDKKYKIINLSNIYGPGDNKASSQKNALQFMVGKLKKGEDVELYNSGHVLRDFLHIDDCVRGIKLIMDKGENANTYNLGYGKSIEIGYAIDLAKERLKSKSKIKSISPPKFHKVVQVLDFEMNTDKVNKLGFRPKISFEEGLNTIL